MPERELAQRAGLGWIGKNTMLIRPGAGSFFFLGTIFTDSCSTRRSDHDRPLRQVHPVPRRLSHRGVRRAAPARRDPLYLLPHDRAEGPIPEPLAERLEGWVFGCDICQEVCPWNQRFAEASSAEAFRSRDALAGAGPELFERMDEEEFARRFGDTPLERAGLQGCAGTSARPSPTDRHAES